MATFADPSPQLSKLCDRCAVFQLTDAPRHGMFASFEDKDREIDLGWEVKGTPESLSGMFEGSDCDSCAFLGEIIFGREFQDGSYTIYSATTARLSFHHVFGPDNAAGFGLKALRIKIRSDNHEEIHLDCPVAAVAGDDTVPLLGLRPPLCHISEENIRWMKSKIDSCVFHDHTNPQKSFIPDRLIEVGAEGLRLVVTKAMVNLESPPLQIPRYIALTYCWGPEPYASKQLKTTSLNLSQHRQSIPESLLPQTIQDSVTLARALSIPFLWVDALCILQDVSEDWEQQCAVMERIYGNAYVAVAAASSWNCEQGFLQRADRIIIHPNPRLGKDSSPAFAVYSPLYTGPIDDEIIISPWLKRGWTFQERITSTRLLIFARRAIHFKCPSFHQSMGRKLTTYHEDFRMLDRDKLVPGDKLRTYHEWDRTVSQLNPHRAHFTRETDLLPSVAGLAALFQKQLDDEYLAGLWKNDLHWGLFWQRMETKETSYKTLLRRLESPVPYIAPSWSWASRLSYFWFGLNRPIVTLSGFCRPEYTGLVPVITPRGSTEFGEVSYGALDMTTKMLSGSRRVVLREGYPLSSFSPYGVELDGNCFAHIRTDCVVEHLFAASKIPQLAAPISFLLVGSMIRQESDGDSVHKTAYGLLIHPTGNPDEYYRVGTFWSEPLESGRLSFFDSLESKRVRLV